MAGLAPFGAEGLDWFAGLAASGVASLRAAAEGRASKERYEASGVEYDPEFTPADHAALEPSSAHLRLSPDDGHISVLNSAAAALAWLREHAARG